ncbi:hypothetical protein IW261DRAFT_1491370 [Armillaria novae-zelandiae]|nr:hypothetical protein IW261DRAFT_1491370 [Armillaria novae-zelandiae]
MWRKRKGVICGVLNDFDLSSYRDHKSASALHRTGTGPYYACDLLKEDPPVHIYRHDLESLFNVLVFLCCRYEIQETPAPEGKDQLVHVPNVPFESWYDMSYRQLWTEKFFFFMNPPENSDKLFPVSVSFSDFEPWLNVCYGMIHQGFLAKKIYGRDHGLLSRFLSTRAPRSTPVEAERFDDATLGGFVDYVGFFTAMHNFAGQDLIARYNPNPEPTA